ncbi:MAG: 23S rRNA (adenine(2503)-C(2))-methyltransferase RlmN [Bacteroidales bacterium]|nr:23S rRNA (adenine(2503)-C(2))-methyltransferase RlmN [Bacteroidales bacterium]
MEKIKLLGHTLAQLKDIAVGLGLPGFVGKQMADWLYKKRVTQIDHMTNLSKAAREKLNERYVVGRTAYTQVTVSKDGTKKYLFPSHTGTFIEAVMIPADDRYTLCVSSQAGCKMGCKFCMTGRMGFKGNLEVAEIISQYLEVDENNLLTNTVFMGMGEPLDNLDNVLQAIEVLTSDWGFGWSPKRITLSTIGVNVGNESPLYRFLNESKAHLAVSLHNPLPDERALIMPMEKPFPIHRTLEIIRQYDFTGQRRVSFEYIMFNHFNDTKAHADAIARLLRGLECRVNLIRFHAIPDSPLETSPMPVIEAFKERLNAAGVTATVRASRGEDVFAACGMLSTRKNPIKR